MCTSLTKPLHRRCEIEGRTWVVTLEPASMENGGFASIRFRQARKRHSVVLPLASVRNYAVLRHIEAAKREKARLKKLKKKF